MIRNIIFDWSGTLVDDLPAVWRTTNYLMRRSGKEELSEDQFRERFTLPFAKFYERYVPERSLSELKSWWHEYFPSVEHLVEPLPQSHGFLEFVKGRGVQTYICSAIHYKQFIPQSERAGFMHLIDARYVDIDDKVERIHDIISENGLEAGETLFIGDMEHDVEAAKSGNLLSCAVLTGYNGLGQLRRTNPDIIVENLNELRSVLEKNAFSIPISFQSKSGEADREKEAGEVSDEAGPEVQSHSPERPISTVGALIFNENNEVLMIQTHKWSDLWGIPGGKIELNESSMDALVREIREETQLEIEDIQFVMVQDSINSDEFYKSAHFLLLNYTCRVKGSLNVKLNDEAQQFRWVTLEEARNLPLNTPTRVLIDEVENNLSNMIESQPSGAAIPPQTITISGLELRVRLGVPDWERELPQSVLLDLDFVITPTSAIVSDSISDTINYAEVVSFLRNLAGQGEWKLLESFISHLSGAIKSQFNISEGTLTLTKKVLPEVSSISVSTRL